VNQEVKDAKEVLEASKISLDGLVKEVCGNEGAKPKEVDGYNRRIRHFQPSPVTSDADSLLFSTSIKNKRKLVDLE